MAVSTVTSRFRDVVQGGAGQTSFTSQVIVIFLLKFGQFGWLVALGHSLVFRLRGFGWAAFKWPTIFTALGWPLLLLVAGPLPAPIYIWLFMWKPLQPVRRSWRSPNNPLQPTPLSRRG